MGIQVGAARLMGDGSGDASVTVQVDGGKKRQVRVVRGMTADEWALHSTPQDLRLVRRSARHEVPFCFCPIGGATAVREILEKGRQVMDDPKLLKGVLKGIRKRREIERRERVKNHSIKLRTAVVGMLQAGATHDEVLEAVNEALVLEVQES